MTDKIQAYVDVEKLSPAFTKFHVRGPWPFHPVIHRFTEPDHGDPHDHPFAFRSFILHGGYVERVFDAQTGDWADHHRRAGESVFRQAGDIHRIIDLPDGDCYTLILPHAHERDAGFYQFRDDGLYHRFWYQPSFQLHHAWSKT